ncbi:MAG TPA: hypothetical protein VKE94_15625 [Gemmataceae bacterium]|nr:hypothetical protein [Gemmataceae bacterium]
MLRLGLLFAGLSCMDEADVQSLIEKLGDDQYAVRVEAQARSERVLLSANGHVYRSMVEAATEHPDLEIARRARAVLDAFYNVCPGNYPVLPWIDMLPANQLDRGALIEGCLFQVRTPGTWGYGSDWPEYRQATAVYSRRLLEQGYPRHCVRQLLDEMVDLERVYREKHGMRELAAR